MAAEDLIHDPGLVKPDKHDLPKVAMDVGEGGAGAAYIYEIAEHSIIKCKRAMRTDEVNVNET